MLTKALKRLKGKKMIFILSLYMIVINCFHAQLNTMNNFKPQPCSYLNSELNNRIEEKEIEVILGIGFTNEKEVELISKHYNKPVYLINEDSIEEVDSTLNNIDLLIVNSCNDFLNLINKAKFNISTIKYIIIDNKIITAEIKDYLEDKNFKFDFYNFNLFSNVLFTNKTKQTPKSFIELNTPTLAPLIKGNINSELIYAAWNSNHTPFHNLEKNKDLNINYQDANGNTPLIAAVCAPIYDNYVVQKLLQQSDLDLNLQNKNGSTALMIAVAMNRIHFIRLLLSDPRILVSFDSINTLNKTAQNIIKQCKYKISIGSYDNTYPINAIQEKVLLCGTCKNVGHVLPSTINIMEKIGGLFADYKIIIHENNSTDNTKSILQNWASQNANVYIQLEDLTPEEIAKVAINIDKDGGYFKADFIARGRNIVLDKALSPEYEGYDYIIMMDMDFETPPPAESIIEIFSSDQEWDAVFAYGLSKIDEYWDWYAFRDYNQPLGPELLGHDWFVPKKWFLNQEDQWYPVYSAFGGCGIYKKSSIKGCRYSGTVTKNMETLYKQIIEAGKLSNHPIILKYLNDTCKLPKIHISFPARPNLPKIKEPAGIILSDSPDALAWKMNSFTYQYPAVVDHAPFHADMIANGHGKLFINPRFIFEY